MTQTFKTGGNPSGRPGPVRLPDLLAPEKFLPVYLERKGLARMAPPHSVELHLTARCNFRCPHCSYANRNAARAQTAPEIANRLLDSLTGPTRPKGIYFSGGGEPTLMPGWERLMIRSLDAGIETALVTNGSLLGEEHMGLLSRLSYMAVSIHSPVKATHALITGGAGFKAQFGLPERVKARGGGVTVGARCVLSALNHSQAGEICRAAREAGYDYVIFIPAVDYEGRGLSLSAAQVRTLGEIAAGGGFDDGFTNFNALARRSFGYYASEAAGRGDGAASPGGALPEPGILARACPAVRLGVTAFVNYDSKVYPCQPNIGRRDAAMGDLRQRPLESFWGGRRHQAVAELLSAEHAAGACANCRALAYNRIAGEYDAAPANTPLTLVKDAFL